MKIILNNIEFRVNQLFIEIDEEKLKNIIIKERTKIEEKIKDIGITDEMYRGIISKAYIDVVYHKTIFFSVYIETKENNIYVRTYCAKYPESIIDEVLKKYEEALVVEEWDKMKKVLKRLIKKVYKNKNDTIVKGEE